MDTVIANRSKNCCSCRRSNLYRTGPSQSLNKIMTAWNQRSHWCGGNDLDLILAISGSNIGRLIGYPIFLVLYSCSKRIPGLYFQTDQDRFLPNPYLSFVINLYFIRSCITDKAETALLKESNNRTYVLSYLSSSCNFLKGK